ncbi:DNA replication protein, partial [Escherichia coli]|nr:DNA replication protein [Escherichia coli]
MSKKRAAIYEARTKQAKTGFQNPVND